MFCLVMFLSTEELIVSIRHLVYVTLYRWPFSVQVWMRHGCPKHVENRNKHIWKKIVHQFGYLQRLYRDARSTEHSNESHFISVYHCITLISVRLYHFPLYTKESSSKSEVGRSMVQVCFLQSELLCRNQKHSPIRKINHSNWTTIFSPPP
jgi:hypothetical protein